VSGGGTAEELGAAVAGVEVARDEEGAGRGDVAGGADGDGVAAVVERLAAQALAPDVVSGGA
jgi:hypothetical protein